MARTSNQDPQVVWIFHEGGAGERFGRHDRVRVEPNVQGRQRAHAPARRPESGPDLLLLVR